MKKTLLLASALLLATALFSQKKVYIDVPCETKEAIFYDLESVEFDYHIDMVIAESKRKGLDSMSDLSEQELKRLRKEAKKLGNCHIICDFDYQTPEDLEEVNAREEKEKKKYNHFYFVTKQREIK